MLTWGQPPSAEQRSASYSQQTASGFARLKSRGGGSHVGSMTSYPNSGSTPGGRQPLLFAALAFAAGIAVGVHAWRPPVWWVAAWIVFALSGAYLFRRRGPPAFILGLGALFFLAALMVQDAATANCTVTICHRFTCDLAAHTRRADILITAVGTPNLIRADMVKPGATVLDVGITRIPDASRKSGTRLVGDVDFEAVREVAGLITPVPGGVGPMTIAMLLRNTVRAAQRLAAA